MIVCVTNMQLVVYKMDTCYKNHDLSYYIPMLIQYLSKLCIVVL